MRLVRIPALTACLRLAAAAALLSLAAPGRAHAGLTLPPELDALAVPGFKAMYRHDFATAKADFSQMVAVRPDHPAGYAFLCSMYWWQFSFQFEIHDQALEDAFFAAATKGIDVAKAYADKKGNAVEGDFWLGGIYGIIGRWHVSQFSFIRAYLNGNKGYKLLKSVTRRDPTLYEAYLGVGEFEYLAARLPGVVRIPALLFVHGDREGGLKDCALAADKARYGTVEAKLFLAAVYSDHEHDYDAAFHWADSVVGDDPDNPFFHIIRAIIVFYKRDFDASAKELEAVADNLEKDPASPSEDMLPMAYYHIALDALLQKNYNEAQLWLDKAVAPGKYHNQGWVTNSLLRRGEVYDLQGQRDSALRDYKAVLDRRNFWDSHKFAQAALDKPVTYNEAAEQVLGYKWHPPDDKAAVESSTAPAAAPAAH